MDRLGLQWTENDHSIYFGQFGPFDAIWSIQSIQSTQIYSIQFGPYGPPRSILSNLAYMVQLGLFSLIWSTQSTQVYSIQFGPFSPFRSIRSNLAHSVNFRSLQSNLVYLLKHGKIQIQVENTINYLSNINCNYIISFGYHNNLLKRMRI